MRRVFPRAQSTISAAKMSGENSIIRIAKIHISVVVKDASLLAANATMAVHKVSLRMVKIENRMADPCGANRASSGPSTAVTSSSTDRQNSANHPPEPRRWRLGTGSPRAGVDWMVRYRRHVCSRINLEVRTRIYRVRSVGAMNLRETTDGCWRFPGNFFETRRTPRARSVTC